MTTRTDAVSKAFWSGADEEIVLQWYHELMNTVDSGVYQLDAQGHVVAVNSVLLHLTGFSRGELLGEHISLLFSDSDSNDTKYELHARQKANTEAKVLDLKLYTADGEAIQCEVCTRHLSDNDGHVGTIGVVQTHAAESYSEERTRETRTINDLLKTTLNKTDCGVFLLDSNFDIVWANETIGRYFGIDETEVIGQSKRELIQDVLKDRFSDGERFAERVLSTYESDTDTEQFECRVSGSDEYDERWLEHRSVPIETGAFAGGRIELYSDITGQKQSKEALQEAEEEFQSVVDVIEEYAIFRLDSTGHVISWNEGAKEIKGYEADEIIGEHFSTFYTEAERQAGIPDRNITHATKFGSVEDEGWRVRKDGSKFWGNVTITGIWDEDGTLQGYLKVTRDMTERHRREQELETELRHILDRISDAFFAVDEDFRLTHINEHTKELLGRREEELLGQQLNEIFPHASESDTLRTAFETAMESQESVSLEYYHEKASIWVEATLYPSETGISVYFRDITERRKYEKKLKASNERLEQFAYAASHDLQEPLRMVSSYLKLIEQRYADTLDTDGREFLDFAVDGADRMRDMIDGLLQYSRVETHGNPMETVELDGVLDDVCESLQMKIEDHDADIQREELPSVNGDAVQLHQLFQNLLGNAIEYSGDEPPHIHVSAEKVGNRWEISVRDEGIGIDPKAADRIFDVFQSLHGDDTNGSGIGLALCERIVERHGGNIWVDSEPGHGATFSFTLPPAGETDE